jgi:hypothetical protein
MILDYIKKDSKDSLQVGGIFLDKAGHLFATLLQTVRGGLRNGYDRSLGVDMAR